MAVQLKDGGNRSSVRNRELRVDCVRARLQVVPEDVRTLNCHHDRRRASLARRSRGIRGLACVEATACEPQTPRLRGDAAPLGTTTQTRDAVLQSITLSVFSSTSTLGSFGAVCDDAWRASLSSARARARHAGRRSRFRHERASLELCPTTCRRLSYLVDYPL